MNYIKLKRTIQNIKMPENVKERIISNCISFAENSNIENSDSEKTHVFIAEHINPHPIRRAVSIAAAFILVVGGISGGHYLISRNNTPKSDDKGNINNSVNSPFNDLGELDFSDVEQMPSELPAQEIEYRELELFSGIPTIENDEPKGIAEVPQEFFVEDDLHNRFGINRKPYIQKLLSADETSLNDIESKSYIYHMMLNSVDYFDSAKGIAYIGDEYFEFNTNITEQTSCEKEYRDGELLNEYEFYDGKPPLIEERKDGNTMITTFETKPNDSFPSDCYRICAVSDGTTTARSRYDWTNLPNINSFLLPQDFAMSRLSDFDTWEITGIEEKVGRKCAVIRGSYTGCDFIMYIDIETGILISYTPSDYKTAYSFEYIITEIEIKSRDF